MTNLSREFDLIIYGATGYTGRLVAEYIAAQHKDISWAMAGRNKDKLASVRDEMAISKNVPLIIADSADEAALAQMVSRTKAVITTVGPYQLYGTTLITACAQNGTDYVDLCGEPAWMHDMVRALPEPAKASGARIVLSCGFDSIPFDLGVYALQQYAIQKSGAPISRVKGRVRKMQGTFSGGTAASFAVSMARAGNEPNVMDWLKDPFTLVPSTLAPSFKGPVQPHGAKPVYDDDLGSWSAPFIMASINTKNIHRSNALLGHQYGKDFVYDEMILTGDGEQGETIAQGIASANPLSGAGGKAVPKPGEGPSKEEREAGFYELLFTGLTQDGARLSVIVSGDKDPGYGSTSKMITEAALCLAQDISRETTGGGVYTSAPAMGQALIERLTQYAGLSFKYEG